MEAIEIVVFVGITVIVGGLFLGFLVDWNTNQTYNSIKSIVLKDKTEITQKKITKDEFVNILYNTWEECGYGELEINKTYYIKDSLDQTQDNEITKEEVFEKLKKINLCDTLQSEDNDCGTREDLDMDDIDLPALVTIKCEEDELVVK